MGVAYYENLVRKSHINAVCANITRSVRASKYTASVAEECPPGTTPEEFREQYAERQRRLERMAEEATSGWSSDEEDDGEGKEMVCLTRQRLRQVRPRYRQ